MTKTKPRSKTAAELNDELLRQVLAVEMTGCEGAGDYYDYAAKQGYPFCKPFDTTSSAGDWTFLVSYDEETWFVMTQTNNYPKPGFTRSIDKTCHDGTYEEVCDRIVAWR